jgi:hypothetical protein
MPRVGFDPQLHGFHFENNFVNHLLLTASLGPIPVASKTIETLGRCGGMAFAALDYYFTGTPISGYRTEDFAPSFVVPPDGHWLADYILFRLWGSYMLPNFENVGMFIQLNRDSDTEVTNLTKQWAFPRLRSSIDAGSPVALGLIRGKSSTLSDIGQNHVVVAYGYDFDPSSEAMRVYVYDNNHRGAEVILSSHQGNPYFATSTGEAPWRGFFVLSYERNDPRAFPFTMDPPASTRTLSYGNTIKLSHVWSGMTLHSHQHNYGHPGTSGLQQVTGFRGSDDNDLWRIKGPHGQPEFFRPGQPVQHGDVVRLEHVLTKRNLHSIAGIPSPITGQQEVSCFGENGIGDENDNWRVEIEGGGTWVASKRTRLIHVSTNHALHSHSGRKVGDDWLPFSHPVWTLGQQEVTGFEGRDGNDWWLPLEVRPVPTRDSRFVAQQGVPRTMTPGQRLTVSVTMVNTGLNTWTPGGATPYRLGSQNPRDNETWGFGRIDVPHPVEPGSEVTFTREIKAPSGFKRYDFQWRMLQETVEWFGEPSLNVPIEVVDCERIREEYAENRQKISQLQDELNGLDPVADKAERSALQRQIDSLRARNADLQKRAQELGCSL